MRPAPLNLQRSQLLSPFNAFDASPGQSEGRGQVEVGQADPPETDGRNIDRRSSRGILDSVELLLLRRILSRLGDPAIRVVLWNGEEVAPASSLPVGCVKIHDRGTLWKLAWNQSLTFGDAYTAGRITIEGDLTTVLTVLSESILNATANGAGPRVGPHFHVRERLRTIDDSRRSVHHHYDIGNDFYKLWLDEQLIYTCAYFSDPYFGLEQAQIAKMDHVCRKLQLTPGKTVVEAGCGWGALALHMAGKYGVQVQAFNLSREQVAYARRRAEQTGLSDQVEFIEDDYRNISGKFDAFVSVGMLEHVGAANFSELGRVVNRSLKAAGLGLIHSIGRNVACPMDAWAEKIIFPGAYPPSLREMMDIFEPTRFSVLDVENLRLHYARTLQLWLQRFERVADKVARMFDERFVRAWRLYLAASVATFAAGELQLFQVVFARATNNEIPWTRGHVYAE